jgi:hypothetical protein
MAGVRPDDANAVVSATVDPMTRGLGASVGRERTSRIDSATAAFTIGALIAGLALLALGQGMTFFADEWATIEGRGLDLVSFLRPFNEHWLGTTILAYRLLFDAVGLHSYVPYLALLIALHLLVATEVFVLVRRAAGPVPALAAGIIALVFGSGFENLYWAMQIGFIGAIALGFGAMLALDGSPSGRRLALATCLLTVSVTTSGLGLVMVAAVGLELVANPRQRRFIAVAAVPAATYLAWFLALGRSGVATTRDPFTLGALAQVPGFVAEGAGAAAGSITGLGPSIGLLVAASVVALAGWRLVREREIAARAVGCLGGIVVLYVLTGLVRAQLSADAALYTRYTYLAGMLLLVALGTLVGPSLRPWPTASRPGLVATAGLAAVLALALTWNVRLLLDGRDLFLARADRTRALVTVALEPLPAAVRPERTLILVPSPASLRRIIDAAGSPLTDALVIGGVPPVSPAALADAQRRLAEGAGPIGPLP